MQDFAAFAEMERDGWSDPETAAAYADDFARAAAQVAPVLAERACVTAGCRVLDLCTGHGIVAAEAAARGASVTGLDFSPAMLAMARKAVPAARFVEGDAMALPFSDASFDAVTIGCGIPHVPDPAAALAEAGRVLRPGGRIAFSVWRGAGSEGAFAWLFEAVAAHGADGIALPPGPDAHAFCDPAIAFPALAAAGFADPRAEEVDSFWEYEDPGSIFDTFDVGTVRGAALLTTQPPAHRAAIRSALAERVAAFNQGGTPPYRVPIPAVVVSARRV